MTTFAMAFQKSQIPYQKNKGILSFSAINEYLLQEDRQSVRAENLMTVTFYKEIISLRTHIFSLFPSTLKMCFLSLAHQ